MNKGNVKALLPIGVFLVLYLGLGFLFEYGLNIPMGFYSIPIVVIFLIALLVACCQNRALPLDEKLVLMGKGAGDKNIISSSPPASLWGWWAGAAPTAWPTSCCPLSHPSLPWRFFSW